MSAHKCGWCKSPCATTRRRNGSTCVLGTDAWRAVWVWLCTGCLRDFDALTREKRSW